MMRRFSLNVGGTYTENSTPLAIITTPVVTDVDASYFNGGSVTALFDTYQTGDVLSVNNQGTGAGQIGVSGTNITYGWHHDWLIHWWISIESRDTLNSSATPAAVQALVGQIVYSSTSDDPTAGGVAPIRAATIWVSDGGNTGIGGPLAVSRSGIITVVNVTDAPTMSSTPLNPSFTEAAGLGTQAGAVSVFSGTATSTVEAGQAIIGLTFTVCGITDGANDENSGGWHHYYIRLE